MLMLTEVEPIDGAGASASAAAAETPATIAAAIRGGARLQAAELDLVRLREQRRQIKDKLAEAVREAMNAQDHSKKRLQLAILPLQEEEKAIEAKIRKLRAEIEPMREARAAKVREALRPAKQQAAERLAKALAIAFEAVGTLNKIAALSAPNGTAPAVASLPISAASLEREARRWAGMEG